MAQAGENNIWIEMAGSGAGAGLPSPRSLPVDNEILMEKEAVLASFAKLKWEEYHRSGFLSPDEVRHKADMCSCRSSMTCIFRVLELGMASRACH